MPILPIDTGRHGTPEMRRIFEEENRVQKLLDVEAALAWAHAEVGDIPRKDADKIGAMASLNLVKLSRIKEIEREIKHDVASLVRALSEVCGSSGRYVHLGATSYDIVDTATALQLKEALKLITSKLNAFENVLMEKAVAHKNTVMVGRTHGQHALPITLGFKFAVWMREVTRHIERVKECSLRLLVGKMSGAVGTQAGLGDHAMQIQELVMKKLGIEAADISTQIVQRDRHAEFACVMALIVSSLENFATEIRELQRPEIGELFEFFETGAQVGSSTMPQKHNPELCERVCGLARIVRSLAIPALEDVTTWHERDLTQSSVERFLLPETCILTDYLLFLMNNIVGTLGIDERHMLQNVEVTQGRIMSEAVMIVLTKKGMDRQEAHELLRKLTIKSELEKTSFRQVLLGNKTVTERLTKRDIDHVLDACNYLGTAAKQVDLMVKKTEAERKARGLK